MATWNSLFEQTPRNGVNPGYGAASIRTLKTAISERGDVDHVWGTSEDGNTATGVSAETGGRHREGSARAYVVDDVATPAERAFYQVADPTGKIGQIKVDMSLLAVNRTQDGDDLDYDDQFTKDITVVIPELLSSGTWDHDNTQLVKVFSAQEFVDVISDQVLRGIKTYIHSPEVPDVGVADTLVDTDAHQYDSVDADKVTTAEEINYAVGDAKQHNIFDPDDDDNVDAGGYVARDIKANVGEFQSLTGLVYV